MEQIYQHYRQEEGPFIDGVFGWMDQVLSTFAPFTSVFLTPRQQMIVQQLLAGSDDLQVIFGGGYEEAERQRALIYPLYYEPDASDFHLVAYNINFPLKFGELSHGKILGTLLSTGIDRDRIGDIITDGQAWHVIMDQSIAEYIRNQVTKIANVGVHLEPLTLDALLISQEDWDEVMIFASSLRLDTLLSKVYNFSRQRAKNYISAGQVKVNFVEMDRPDQEIGENDIVSLRKFGRFWIDHIDGMTKKENYRLSVRVLVR